MATNPVKKKAVAYTQVYDGKPAVFLTGFIHEGYGLEFAHYLANEAKAAGGEVTLFMDSPGGLVKEGFAFYDFVRANNVPFRVEGYGEVGSIATIMAAGAGKDKISLAQNAGWFIHRTRFINDYGETVQGNEEELARLNTMLVNAYMELTGKSAEEIEALMDRGDGGYTFTAAEAMELGFIGSILPSARAAAFKSIQPATEPTTNTKTMSTKKVAVKLSLLQAVASLITSEGATVEVDVEAETAKQLEEKDATIAELQGQIATLEAAAKPADPGDEQGEKIEEVKAQLETAKAEASKQADAVAAKEAEIVALNTKLAEALKAPLATRTVADNRTASVAAAPNAAQKTEGQVFVEGFFSKMTPMQRAEYEARAAAAKQDKAKA